jgi:hypothetical protein
VLVTVQLVMIAHVILWLAGRKYGWFGGQTLTPVEPSESMEFVKHGVINAGLIFFALALLGTLIFGRFFCGWGCHIVMLQDFCSWIMKKCGVRPKAFRSRFLIYVPLILALYMFVWPAVYRWAVIPASQALAERWSAIPNLADAPPWGLQTHLTTAEFWKTFPGVMVAIPFLSCAVSRPSISSARRASARMDVPMAGSLHRSTSSRPGRSASPTPAKAAATAPPCAPATCACTKRCANSAWWSIPAA